jgi:hypothetical protein
MVGGILRDVTHVRAASWLAIMPLLLSLLALWGVHGSEMVSSHSSHDPIVISGNSGFTNASGVVWGSGTAADPYIIEGWEINTTSVIGIMIVHTTAHFEIRNVYVHGDGVSHSGDGIRIEDSSNGTIEACELSNNWESVFMLDCVDMKVSHCNVSNSLVGISLFQWDSRVTVDGNRIWGNQEGGIFIFQSRDIVLASNAFENDGIIMSGDTAADFSTHTIPENNTVNGLQ